MPALSTILTFLRSGEKATSPSFPDWPGRMLGQPTRNFESAEMGTSQSGRIIVKCKTENRPEPPHVATWWALSSWQFLECFYVYACSYSCSCVCSAQMCESPEDSFCQHSHSPCPQSPRHPCPPCDATFQCWDCKHLLTHELSYLRLGTYGQVAMLALQALGVISLVQQFL